MIKVSLQKKLIGSEGKIDLDISVEINKNDFVVIFGKSGAGKTSFIRMLAGLLTPDNGYISVNNQTWFDNEKKSSYLHKKEKSVMFFKIMHFFLI